MDFTAINAWLNAPADNVTVVIFTVAVLLVTGRKR